MILCVSRHIEYYIIKKKDSPVKKNFLTSRVENLRPSLDTVSFLTRTLNFVAPKSQTLTLKFPYPMSTERRRKVSLFDVVDDTSVSAKHAKTNGTTSFSGKISFPPSINRWSGRPYSARYFEILEKRKTLPVWQQKDEFLDTVRKNQTLVLVGETGSGKTTQVSY